MNDEDISCLFEAQKTFFRSGATRDISFRIGCLDNLERMIRENEASIASALKHDLGKPDHELYAAEIDFVLMELSYARKHLKRWMKPTSAGTMRINFPAKSTIVREPYGVALIIAPWNYPFQLILSPLIGAVAAGNCVIIKPSEHASSSSDTIAGLIDKYCLKEHIAVINGGISVTKSLLDHPFDYIFFTGGVNAGTEIMKAAARHCTPCTLELGGKNPCIVDHDVDIDVTARRIAWGKFFNAGQTCIAPDYLCVDRRIKHELIAALKKTIIRFYGENPMTSPDYGRIINDLHFNRLINLLNEGVIVQGGAHDRATQYIAPTIIDEVNWDSDIMKDEIFGPILPVITYDSSEELVNSIVQLPKPLSLYVFSKKPSFSGSMLEAISSGNAFINGTLTQIMSFTLPFGGVGKSGMGRYHGKYSFDTFTHERSVMHKPFFPDFSFVYPPYRMPMQYFRRALKYLIR